MFLFVQGLGVLKHSGPTISGLGEGFMTLAWERLYGTIRQDNRRDGESDGGYMDIRTGAAIILFFFLVFDR